MLCGLFNFISGQMAGTKLSISASSAALIRPLLCEATYSLNLHFLSFFLPASCRAHRVIALRNIGVSRNMMVPSRSIKSSPCDWID